ncbi:MAG: S8 family serine peptidase [Candidatus Thermoplasmatota archaeon]|nr:S8 family serine peptidase [Candidatus Thermoplasmatota archaeon]
MRRLLYLMLTAMLFIPFGWVGSAEPDLSVLKDEKTNRPTIDAPVGTDRPWWEVTSLDLDRNSISDALDEVLSTQRASKVDVTISYSRDISERDLRTLDARGFQVSALIPQIDALVLIGTNIFELLELSSLEGVIFIEPIGLPMLFSDIATPSVRARGSEMYSPETAWELGSTGKGVSISIIDTGIDDEHPSLSGKFLGGVDMTKPDNLPFLYPQDGTYNPDDIQGHGSTCAGIATGTGAPEGEYAGTAPDARLVDIRIGTKIGYAPGEFWVGAVGDPNLKDGTLRGIRWGIENVEKSWTTGGSEYVGIDIMSLSWGVDIGQDSDGNDQYSRLLDSAVDAGAIVVNAAGNDGPDNTGFTGLSASSKAIIVAATADNNTLDHADDIIAFYSSRGPRLDNGDSDPYDELKPDIAAPGTTINNLQPDTTRITGDASSNGYGARGSGTSYATPLVAGVIALMLESNPLLDGRCELVKEILRYTADRQAPPTLPTLDPFWERDHGWGTVDAYNAVRLSMEVEDPDGIDTMLQSHITNISGVEDARPYHTYNTSSSLTVSGLGWSRGGSYELTEVRVDDGPWRQVREQTTDDFNPWSFRVEGLSKGQHRICARSISGDTESLHSWVDINVVEMGGGGEGIVSGGLLIPLLLIVAALGIAAIIGYRVYRKRLTSSE